LRHSRNVCHRPDDQAEEGGDADAQRPQVGGEHGACPLDLGSGDHREAVAGREPLHHPQVDADDQGGAQAGEQADDRLGAERAPEQVGLVDLPEPEQVGVEAGEAADGDQDEEGQQQDGQRPAAGRTAGCDHVRDLS
jgi:hypothetical protein